ncbi:MAG: DUF5320 domain-containing protein [Candidatus Bathyarchaeota archaeon]|jgi:hypothetical protein
MGWRGRGGGWSGRWPGRGPFSHLPPWQRPGWLYRYGRGYYGYGRPYGYGYVSPYSCARFPWLPRWWWANPDYTSNLPYPPATDPGAELERLEAEKEALMRDIENLKKHVEEGTTPSGWPARQFSPYAPYGFPAATPEQEREFLEQQRDLIVSQMESIKKRLEDLEKED